MDSGSTVEAICTFLDRIGIAYELGEVGESTFLPGLLVDRGRVIIDRERLTYPGDILHEAGHLALIPEGERAGMTQELLANRPTGQGEEIGVQLWTYLAALEIGLPPEVVFHAGGYQGSSEWFVENYGSGNYIGLPLLTWMGIAVANPEGGPPAVKRWLRE